MLQTGTVSAGGFERAEAESALGAVLVEGGRIGRGDLDRAARLAAERGEALAAMLSRLGLVTERALAGALADALDMALVGAGEFPETRVPLDGLSPRFLRERRCLPLAVTAEGLVLAMADPLDAYACDAVRLATGLSPILCITEPGAIESAVARLYGDLLAGEAEEETGAGGEEIDAERLKDLASEAPVVQLVNTLIARAVEAGASDIHFEPLEREFRVRFRIDGVLEAGEPLPERLRAAVISRIKIMARLDIAERRLPQDGRIRTVVRGKTVDLRVSTLQIMHGESVVMRVLDRDSVALDLERLGITGRPRADLDAILASPNGLFLVTGPTGSGKTTTLYAALAAINAPGKKIITVEDPVEYQLEGVNQVQVEPAIGLDFAHVLRSMLRQDPDIALVGEIRDEETASIAARAALTGHLVLATLHTNDAAGAVTRLMDMGVEDYLLMPALLGVAGQRLVRRLCPDCREAYAPPDEVVERLGLSARSGRGPVTLYRPRGCRACQGRGYRGRTVIVEVLRMTEELRRLGLSRPGADAFAGAAREQGMVSMLEDGIAKALAGETTLEEVLRSTRDA